MSDKNLHLLLARWVEGRLSEAEAESLQALLAVDPSIADAMAGLAEIEGLEKSGALEALDSGEASAFLQQLHAMESDVTESTSENEGTESFFEDSDAELVRNGDLLASTWDGKEIQNMNPAIKQRQQAIDSLFGSQNAEAAPETVGRPAETDLFSLNVKQEYLDNCAVKCQQLILEEFGIDVSADELVRMAYANGWYLPGNGTAMDDVGKLLEAYGIEVVHYDNANIFNLVSELAQGRQIIIAVHSGDLWSSNEIIRDLAGVQANIFPQGMADHAVIVSGVDISDPINPVVVITDPGTGQVAAEYPLADFLEAWEDSGFRMVSTAISPDQFQVEHIDAIGEIPYEAFARFYPHVAEMTGFEPFFSRLCETFREQIHNPLASHLNSLLELLPGVQPPAGQTHSEDLLAGGFFGNGAHDSNISDDVADMDGDNNADQEGPWI